jgi:folylpolyglutamate synthase
MVAVRERIRINGKPISEEAFAKYFFDLWDSFDAHPEVRPEHSFHTSLAQAP